MFLFLCCLIWYACQVEGDFEERWTNNKVEGWELEVQENGYHPAQHTVIDLDYYSSVEELVEVGPERLKEVGHKLLPISNSKWITLSS